MTQSIMENPVLNSVFRWRFALAILTLCATAVAAAPGNDSKKQSKSGPAKVQARTPDKPVETKTESGETEMQTSVFTIPSNFKEGRDPFFPSRQVTGVPTVKTTKTTAAPFKLVLSGMSGTKEKPLAMINNRTFEKGEEADIVAGSGRVRVRCVEIKDTSVIVELNGQRQELRLRDNL